MHTTTLWDLTKGFEAIFNSPTFAGQNWPQFEHRALHDLSSGHFLDRGYEVVRGEVGRLPIFLQGGSDRVELIASDVPPHIAYATRHFSDLRALMNHLVESKEFELVEGGRFDVDRNDLRAVLLKHVTSGDVIQLIWRHKQIFRGVFPE
ncbi:MAG: hypothetical protein HZA80_03610 [Candidatus Taylorbacteria bacterium]|nr:hypothetical protein [Candidatus Taylorbacteria bacterium]